LSSTITETPTPAVASEPALSKSEPIAGIDNASAWSVYINSLNGKYQEKIKRLASLPNYNLHLRYEDGREEKQVFTRMKLLQWQFDELEDLRSSSQELATTSPRESTKSMQKMYKKAAGYILFNPQTKKPITEDEYKHCELSDVRPALDAAILLALVGDPN
jgi:hypothetical protein